nr:MAG TPA: hypothetical protein [Caudoviricetes sp.]
MESFISCHTFIRFVMRFDLVFMICKGDGS